MSNEVGTIPSESFDIFGPNGTTPEPGSVVLLGSMLVLAQARRRKLSPSLLVGKFTYNSIYQSVGAVKQKVTTPLLPITRMEVAQSGSGAADPFRKEIGSRGLEKAPILSRASSSEGALGCGKPVI